MGKRVQMFYGKLRVSLRRSLGWIPRSCVDSFENHFSFKKKYGVNRTQQMFPSFNIWGILKYS